MQKELTPEYVKENYPGKLNEAKKHFKDTPKKWRVEWAQRIEGMSFVDVMNQISKPKPEPLPAKTRLKNWMESVVGLRLVAIFGRKRKEFELQTIPDVLIEAQKELINKDIAEEERVAKLTPEELQNEMDDTLEQLAASQGPGEGFGIFYLPRTK